MIYIDADNTLWDTDAVYANAQLQMLERVEKHVANKAPDVKRLEFVREYDQDIAAIHHLGLKYPPALLAVSLGLALNGFSHRSAVNTALKRGALALPGFPADLIQETFFSDLEALPALRRGVKKGLKKLATLGEPLVLLTEGHKGRCESFLKHYGLVDYFQSVMENRKTASLYQRLWKKNTNSNKTPIMIGDQLDRDVTPANHAGFITFYFPGGFTPKWTPQEGDANPDFKVSSFDQAVDLIVSIRSKADIGDTSSNQSSAVSA